MISKKNIIEFIIILLVASFFFFMFPITIQPDSTDYIKYLNIFNEIGKKSFTILYLLLPILLIISFCFYCKNKNQNLLFLIILFSSTLVNIIFLSFCGSIIDRYAYVMYPEIVLGIYIMLNTIELKGQINKRIKWAIKIQ